jgi:hypothetical protein
MKHVRESLQEFEDYKFFSLFEEEKAGMDKETLQSKEKDGLAIIDKITKNFDQFKKAAGGEILKFKEFWDENQQTKQSFTQGGNIYKLFNSDYVVGVMELPPQTLSDGSIEGGTGASEEPEEEIIEGKEITPKVEQTALPTTPVTEAKETEDPALDLGNLGDEKEDLLTKEPTDTPAENAPAQDLSTPPAEDSMEAPTETPLEEPVQPTADLTSPQTYLVVYDLAGDGREEIFRCGSNNVVKGFNSFYNDTFKGSMKEVIAQYKQKKEQEKIEAEKAEKAKKETEKANKVKKFLGDN